jgi:hypothetical protein
MLTETSSFVVVVETDATSVILLGTVGKNRDGKKRDGCGNTFGLKCGKR